VPDTKERQIKKMLRMFSTLSFPSKNYLIGKSYHANKGANTKFFVNFIVYFFFAVGVAKEILDIYSVNHLLIFLA
jgi:hypothetical protein